MDFIDPIERFLSGEPDQRHDDCIDSWRNQNNEEDRSGMSDPIDVFKYFPDETEALNLKLKIIYNCMCGNISRETDNIVVEQFGASEWISAVDDSYWDKVKPTHDDCNCGIRTTVDVEILEFPAFLIFHNTQNPRILTSDDKLRLNIDLNRVLEIKINESIKVENQDYECVGIIWFGGGHYTVDVKDPIIAKNQEKERVLSGWYHYDGLDTEYEDQYLHDHAEDALLVKKDESPCLRPITEARAIRRDAWPKIYIYKRL
jgi:hypothetical protein